MLSNQPLDKMHSVNQSLFTSTAGAFKVTAGPKIGVQQNKFTPSFARAVPSMAAKASKNNEVNIPVPSVSQKVEISAPNSIQSQLSAFGQNFSNAINDMVVLNFNPQQNQYSQLATPAGPVGQWN